MCFILETVLNFISRMYTRFKLKFYMNYLQKIKRQQIAQQLNYDFRRLENADQNDYVWNIPILLVKNLLSSIMFNLFTLLVSDRRVC